MSGEPEAQQAGQDVDVEEMRSYVLSQEINLETLSSLLDERQNEQARLSRELEASTSSLEALLQETKVSLGDFTQQAETTRASYLRLEEDLIEHHDTLISPLSSQSQQSATLMETLQGYDRKVRGLERAKHLFGFLAKAEELHLIIKEQIKLPSSDSAIESYCEFVRLTHSMYAQPSAVTSGLAIAPFICELCSETWRDLCKALEAKLVITLDKLSWPNKKVQVQMHQLDYRSDESARQFKNAFLELIRLEQTGSQNPLPSHSSPESEDYPCLLPIVALAHPLVLRFRYHFDGKRQTNRLDKPEWYFAHVLNALSDHEHFVRDDIQALLRQGNHNPIDAMTDFITALLRPLTKKIRLSVPQLLDLPSIFAHTVYQALQFDEKLRQSFAYRPRQTTSPGLSREEWKGTADTILGNAEWFTGWKNAEKQFADDKYFEIISSSDAFHINEDYGANVPGTLQPTNSALRIRDLFDQITDRYRPLPEFSLRLPFLIDIQLPLLEAYLQRINSVTDAFETLSFGLMRAVPGSIAGGESGTNGPRLTNGVNGLQRLIRAAVSAHWMKDVCKEWSEDLFFLDQWQDVCTQAVKDPRIKAFCNKLLNRSVYKEDDPGVFEAYIYQFRELAERIEALIIKHINREITGELKSYLARRWDNSFEASGSDGISSDLLSAITVFSALMSALSASLPAIMVNRLYRAVTVPLQEVLLTRGVLPKVWSEKGGKQFLLDVEYGWITAVREATFVKIKRPENGLRRLLDAAKLVSLPTASGGENIAISKVVQAVWDDKDNVTLEETLSKIGVKEITGRQELKAILRKRPECWR